TNEECAILGCTDVTATNYDATSTVDDGSCTYVLDPMVNLFFSEAAEGSGNNKYLEIYNPTPDTVYLSSYAFPNVSNSPTTEGEYEYWNTFPDGAFILPNDVYVIAHPSADDAILAEADHTFTYLSNGDDGFCLVYGYQDDYTIMDCVGDWNGDPGSGWTLGDGSSTQNNTIVRDCSVSQGNADWSTVSQTEWTGAGFENWSDLGMHTSPCIVEGCVLGTVYISEAHGSGDPEDYIEIFNSGDSDCSLEGFLFDDSGYEEGGFADLTFGNVIVPAGGYVVFYEDYEGSFGSGISGGGENLYLGDTLGNVLMVTTLEGDLGSTNFTADGTACSSTPTPGAENDACAAEPVLGCTDASADNFDPNATVDDGS
ncbi:MAG: hypothetical protein EBW42_15845, partial [Rhodobacterales bacterium]|nr:hypothetical protein [Rhodobacterales bacterium]